MATPVILLPPQTSPAIPSHPQHILLWQVDALEQWLQENVRAPGSRAWGVAKTTPQHPDKLDETLDFEIGSMEYVWMVFRRKPRVLGFVKLGVNQSGGFLNGFTMSW